MPTLLAECKACGRPFPVGEIGDGAFTFGPPGSSVHIRSMSLSGGKVTLEDAQVSCPRCGAMGDVPDGVYDTMRASAAVLRRLSSTDRQQLIDLLTGLRREERPSPADVDSVLTDVPAEARNLLAPLLKGDKWKYWLPILIAIVAIIIQHRDTNREIDQAHLDSREQIQQARAEAEASQDQLHAEITRVIEAILAEAGDGDSSLQSAGTAVDTPKLGRNQPCWCGSGKKFKRCHG